MGMGGSDQRTNFNHSSRTPQESTFAVHSTSEAPSLSHTKPRHQSHCHTVGLMTENISYFRMYVHSQKNNYSRICNYYKILKYVALIKLGSWFKKLETWLKGINIPYIYFRGLKTNLKLGIWVKINFNSFNNLTQPKGLKIMLNSALGVKVPLNLSQTLLDV